MFLQTLEQRIDGIARDADRLTAMGEQMAGHLLRGGEIFVPPVAPWFVSETIGRSGGLMGIRREYEPQSRDDVGFITLPRKWDEDSTRHWRRLIDSPARIFVVGNESELSRNRDRVQAFTGLGIADDVAGVRPFEQLVRAWLVTGEMIAACTRAGRMPHIWMSVWLEGALVRNASFIRHDNLREPWRVRLFHEHIHIPPMSAGYASEQFLAELRKIHRVLVQQTDRLGRAAQWMAQARHVSVVAVGHAYPEILEASDNELPVQWSDSKSDLRLAHPQELGEGDVALHLGYAPVNVEDVSAILARGIRFIYTSPYGRPGALTDHPNLLWLDLPWRPADATIDVPGYSVRICPMSSSAHTMAYFALLEEMKLSR